MNSDIDFYNSLELSLEYAESLLEDAVSNSKSIFHSPTLSILNAYTEQDNEIYKLRSKNSLFK